MNKNQKNKTNITPTMIQQTLHKSMFIRARSNSVGAIPKDVGTHDITLDIENKNETKENEKIWQPDRIPPAKRKRTETSSPLTENAKKKSNAIVYTIPTQNHFEIQGDEEDKADNLEIETPPKPEPMFLTGVLDITSLNFPYKNVTKNNNRRKLYYDHTEVRTHCENSTN